LQRADSGSDSGGHVGRLDGKVVIITGGTRGMGEAEVRGCVQAGARVVFGGRDTRAGERIAAELDGNALFVPHDVAVEAEWERIVRAALARFGRITSLVNNAGMVIPSPIADMTVADLDACYRTNQLGTLLGIKHVVVPMRQNGSGSIVNIGSVAAIKAHKAIAAYSGTKAAVIGITKAAALELAAEQIRVNVVHPGYFATAILDAATNNADRNSAGDQVTPMGRTAKPAEIVGTIVYLLCDDSQFVTGAQFTIDGGYTI
jgi:3alpha(or 20beta)-hydroxysteroid dehydrogenase